MVCRFSLSSCGARAPGHIGSVVCGMRALSLRHASSVVAARGLSCPTACGILVPQPGMEPMSPALEGGFFTTGPPGKSLQSTDSNSKHKGNVGVESPAPTCFNHQFNKSLECFLFIWQNEEGLELESTSWKSENNNIVRIRGCLGHSNFSFFFFF